MDDRCVSTKKRHASNTDTYFFTMSAKTNNKTNKTSFTAAHNDSLTTRKRFGSVSSTGSSILSSGGVISVAESIVRRETSAVACNKIVDNPAISSSLATSALKKAFAMAVHVAHAEDGSSGERLGQCGFIRCDLQTLPGSPPQAKKQRLLGAYGPAPAPAIKQSSSAKRFSVIPVTALHNVVKDVFRGEPYVVNSVPRIANTGGITKDRDFERRNEACSPAAAKRITFPDGNSFSWKYGFDITTGDPIRKVTMVETDPNLSFEAVDSEFVYKVGQKIGIAVYRNYEFDFTNDDIYTNNRWKKEDFPQNAIMRIFGEDNAVNIYTGEITAVTPDKEVFRHSINAFRGCSGAIVFLLDKNQGGLVEDKHLTKAVGVHVGTFQETTTTTTADRTESHSSQEQFNIAFAIAGVAEKCGISEEE